MHEDAPLLTEEVVVSADGMLKNVFVYIKSGLPDGKTYGTPTWIWAVVVGGDLYVRAYNGRNSRWYQAAMKQKAGRIQAAGMIKEVAFEPVEGDINAQIDEAYKKKYSDSPYLSPMIGSRAKAATVKIVPRET